jgi:hypothetical protein
VGVEALHRCAVDRHVDVVVLVRVNYPVYNKMCGLAGYYLAAAAPAVAERAMRKITSEFYDPDDLQSSLTTSRSPAGIGLAGE